MALKPTFAIAIPAYRPSSSLITMVASLRSIYDGPIIIVDDGSGGEYSGVFAQLEVHKVDLLRNAVNLGKGSALKNAFNYALLTYPDLLGVITADADGQHATGDILAIVHAMAQHPGSLIMGAREFGGDTPLRSRVGNSISRFVYRGLLGLNLRDTQTGLRGVPASLCAAALSIKSNRYEFETEMLTLSAALKLQIHEVTIETIYEDNNSSSHFDPLFDSIRIYFVVLRYAFSSIVTALVDVAVFLLIAPLVPNIIFANLISRTFGLAVQFNLLRLFVFHSDGGWLRLALFVGYVAVTGVVSGALQISLSASIGMPMILAKLVVDSGIFIFNFLFLRDILFRDKRLT